MKNISIILILLIALSSCKSKSNTVRTSKKHYKKKVFTSSGNKVKSLKNYKNPTVKTKRVKENSSTSKATIVNKIIENALTFQGTKYKYGGTTKNGMDCSGLIYTSSNLANVKLPRTSFEQSKKGTRVPLKKVKIGDLLFFKTGKKNKISHVGLVVNVNSKSIEFIHTSSSKGVTISSLNETYWSKTFSIAKRVFN